MFRGELLSEVVEVGPADPVLHHVLPPRQWLCAGRRQVALGCPELARGSPLLCSAHRTMSLEGKLGVVLGVGAKKAWGLDRRA